MICVACKARHHEDCPGGSWCDCQHLPAPGAEAAAGADAGPGDTTAAAEPAMNEPAVNWIHQG